MPHALCISASILTEVEVPYTFSLVKGQQLLVSLLPGEMGRAGRTAIGVEENLGRTGGIIRVMASMKMLMEEFHNRISVPALVLLPVVTPNLNRDLPKPQTLIKAIMEIMVEEEVGVRHFIWF